MFVAATTIAIFALCDCEWYLRWPIIAFPWFSLQRSADSFKIRCKKHSPGWCTMYSEPLKSRNCTKRGEKVKRNNTKDIKIRNCVDLATEYFQLRRLNLSPGFYRSLYCGNSLVHCIVCRASQCNALPGRCCCTDRISEWERAARVIILKDTHCKFSNP